VQILDGLAVVVVDAHRRQVWETVRICTPSSPLFRDSKESPGRQKHRAAPIASCGGHESLEVQALHPVSAVWARTSSFPRAEAIHQDAQTTKLSSR
jgi:hypothetical protein